jgi:UDP-N-acetylglucosamine--dolichyl-phosphate N-acetylglucosaminephosphotransferase
MIPSVLINVYLAVIVVSFITTFVTIPWLIPRFKARSIVGIDMNKSDKPEIPEMGGLAVVIGFFVGIYSQIVMYEVYDVGLKETTFLMFSLTAIMGIALIGMLDDLLGMRQRTKAVLPFLFALPLGVFVPKILFIPFIGNIDFGYAMLFLVPFGITCASNSMNMLEGFNGLGTGLGVIITVALIIMAVKNEKEDGLYLLTPLLGALIAFLCYNRYPAKIFPGDTLTLFMGGIIGCSAITSNLKLEGAILMAPMIAEFFLKLRGHFKGECFATVNKDGVLIHKGKIESLTHLVMITFVVTEKKLVYIFWGFEILLATFVISLDYMDIV